MAEHISYHEDQGVLYIALKGRITSANAPDIEAEVNEARATAPGAIVCVDGEELEYISSAGLRILLRLRKEDPKMGMINVSPEVYEILDMTGFTEMFPVKKAFRKLSIDGCEIIGKGANGAVYRYDPETIVKLYFNSDALPEIENERNLARKALVMGVNTAIPYDVVKIGDSYGTVMELLEATSLSKMIKANPEDLDTPAEYYVEMLKTIHGTDLEPGDMPDMKKTALSWAEFDRDHLPEEIGNKLYSMVEDVPEINRMMHGDYHTGNIMVREGEALLIDMDTLCMGHPVFELGSMFNAFVGFLELQDQDEPGFLGFSPRVARRFWEMTLPMYLDTDDEERIRDVENKAKIIGYMRLLRRTIRRDETNRDELIAHYRKMLMDLVPQVDTLDF